MYKTIPVVLLIVVYLASGVPIDLEGNLVDEPSQSEGTPVDESSHSEPEYYVKVDRISRATCDLLSAEIQGLKLNHAACAAHCIVKGFKGGWCDNGACHCRK